MCVHVRTCVYVCWKDAQKLFNFLSIGKADLWRAIDLHHAWLYQLICHFTQLFLVQAANGSSSSSNGLASWTTQKEKEWCYMANPSTMWTIPQWWANKSVTPPYNKNHFHKQRCFYRSWSKIMPYSFIAWISPLTIPCYTRRYERKGREPLWP